MHNALYTTIEKKTVMLYFKKTKAKQVLILFLVFILFAAFACDRKDPEDIENEIKDAETVGEWIDALSQRPDDYTPPEATHSTTLIEDAYASGSISLGSYYDLMLTAALDHASLDKQYAGVPDNGTDLTMVLRKLRRDFTSLTAQEQQKLKPYLLSCDNESSFWYDDTQVRSPINKSINSPIATKPLAAMTRPRSDGSYFYITGPPGTEPQQQAVRNALEKAYRMYTDLAYVEPSDWIRVQLANVVFSDPAQVGYERMANWAGRDRCHIDIKTGQDNDTMKSVVAHELFHCFQEYMTNDGGMVYDDWATESTAVWHESYVYPRVNREHIFDDELFAHTNYEFFSRSGEHHYASYLFWQYYYQQSGSDAYAVKLMVDGMFSEGKFEYLSERPAIYEEFKNYALWLFNQEPYKYFVDHDGEPSLNPYGASVVFKEVTHTDSDKSQVRLPAGAIGFYAYQFAPNVAKVEFDLTEIQKNEDNHNGIQMIYLVGSDYFYEDVSYNDTVTFCLTRPSEDLSMLTFIISNGNLDDLDNASRLEADIPIDATGICTPSWHGYVECSGSSSGEGDGKNEYSTAGSYTSTNHGRIDEVLRYDEEERRFYTDTMDISYQSNYRWYVEYAKPESSAVGYTAWEEKTRVTNGYKSYDNELDDYCPPDCPGSALVIKPDEDDETQLIRRSRTYSDVCTYQVTHQVMNMPGSLGVSQGHVPELWVDEYGGTSSATVPYDPIILHMADNGTHMSGTYQEDNYSCTAVYVYE